MLPKPYLEADIGYHIINVAVTLIVLQTIFTCLFYWSRYTTKTISGLDCWLFMPIGYVMSTATCVCGICMIRYFLLLVKLAGVGRHVQAVILDDPNKLTTRPKIDKAVEIFSVAALTGSKLVILSLYLRVFSSRPYRIATYLTGAIIVATWFTFFILSFTICRPLAFQWDKTIPGGHCLNIIRAYQILGAPNILTDVIMLILPIPAVYNLRVNLATKIGVLVTFLTGSAGLIASSLRLNSFIHAEIPSNDPTWNSTAIYTLTIIEPVAYLIASTLPALRPLKRQYFPKHSCTKALEVTLKKFGIENSKNWSLGLSKRSKVEGAAAIQSSSKDSSSQDHRGPHRSSPAKLNDVGCLMPGNKCGHSVSSRMESEDV